MMKLNLTLALVLLANVLVSSVASAQKIDREALVARNNPHITKLDTMASLNVGNGDFSFTADVTGLQSFPELYKNGVPLGTMSNWGWHSFPNTKNLRPEEDLEEYDFGHGHKELYATQFKVDKNAPLAEQQRVQRKNDAANYFRSNPHRLHLGVLGFDFPNNPWRSRGMKSVKTNVEEMVGPGEAVATAGKGNDPLRLSHKGEGNRPDGTLPLVGELEGVDQTLNMMTGELCSKFRYAGKDYAVSTYCNPKADQIAAHIVSKAKTPLCLRFPYPTGGHSDDACDWAANDKHSTKVIMNSEKAKTAVLLRTIDSTTYYVIVNWEGKATFEEKSANYFTLTPKQNDLKVIVSYVESLSLNPAININPLKGQGVLTNFDAIASKSTDVWTKFWNNTGVVDFSDCTDPRAPELERRVMLSEWLLATQCAGKTPPQETGLTYNSWFGKFHLEMIWWHQSWLALYNHPKKAANTLKWYEQAEPIAKDIAERQGFKGVRWMKMTDPSATEAPSKVGSFLIWQQPHYIYLSELIKRTAKAKGMSAADFKNYSSPEKMSDLIQKTAEFMGDFATKEYYNANANLNPNSQSQSQSQGQNYRYVLKGVIAAQETLRASETVNPPFEVAYWKFALELAQKDREERGLPRNEKWDDIINHLSPLKAISDDNAGDGSMLYLASENALDTYTDERFTSDHMAVLGAIGILPDSRLVDKKIMKNTFNWIWDNWRWEKTWGWDHPMTAMCAARLGMPEKAVGALLMDKRTNTYLPNGHNYQDQRLRCYLPGNGGLLTAVALMCAGWDGCTEKNPGFPKDGKWNVKWENIYPMP